VQEDRAGYSGGGNLYAYVNGNVLQARDPEGLRMAWTDAGFGFEPICTLSGSALQFDGSVVSGACNQYPGSGGSGGAAALIAWAAGQEFNQLQRDIRNGTLIVSFTDADGRTQTVEIRLRDLGSSSSCSFCSLIPEGAAVFIGAALDAASPLGGFTFAVGSFLDSHGHGSYTRLGVAAGLDLSVGIEGGYACSFQKYSLSYQVGVGPVSGTVSASPLLGVSASIGASLFPLSFSGSYSYTTMKYRGFWAPAR
jgi:hypothetical protein